MIKVLCVGKIKEKYLVNLIEDYLKRINKYHHIELFEIIDSNKKDEGIKMLKSINQSYYKIALDIKGEEMNSLDFASFVDKTLMQKANIMFIIGGSDGISDDVLKLVDKRISFSKLTFPHGLFRGILLEQIYRAFKIKNNETYHK